MSLPKRRSWIRPPSCRYNGFEAGWFKDPSHGKLKWFTLSGDGLEINEALYELHTAAAWSSEPINLDAWLVNFSINHYGACPPAVTESWQLLSKSC